MAATLKCLAVAEKIIQALDDRDINQRYFTVKDKILKLSPEPKNLHKLREENKLLHTKQQQLHDQLNSHSKIEAYIVQELSQITKEIIPNSSFSSQHFTDACEDLIDAYQTTLEGHKFLRQKLTEEQKVLQETLVNLKTAHTDEMASIRQKRTLSAEQWKHKKTKMHEHIDDFKFKIHQMKAILAKLDAENQQLEDECTSVALKPPKLREHLEKLENKGAEIELKRNRLLKQKAALNFQIKKLRNEETELSNLNEKLHVVTSPKMIINQLRLQVEELETTKAKYMTKIHDACS